MIVTVDGECVFCLCGQNQPIDSVVVNEMNMRTGLVIDVCGEFHAIGLGDEFVECKAKQHGLLGAVIVDEFGLCVVGIEVKILIQKVDLVGE